MKKFDHKTGKYFTVDDCKIYCEMHGAEDRPVLLFLHGGLSHIEEFNDIIAALDDSYRIIGIDSRGQGKSTLGKKPLSYGLLQKEVEHILKELNIQKLSVIGYSNGATVALRLAAFTDLEIPRLVAISSPWSTKRIAHILEHFSQLTLNIWKEKCPHYLKDYEKLNPEPDIAQAFNQVLQMALDKSSSGRPEDAVRNIRSDTLIISGEEDPLVSQDDVKALSEHILHASSLHVPSY